VRASVGRRRGDRPGTSASLDAEDEDRDVVALVRSAELQGRTFDEFGDVCQFPSADPRQQAVEPDLAELLAVAAGLSDTIDVEQHRVAAARKNSSPANTIRQSVTTRVT
jgi:hypothetical protein